MEKLQKIHKRTCTRLTITSTCTHTLALCLSLNNWFFFFSPMLWDLLIAFLKQTHTHTRSCIVILVRTLHWLSVFCECQMNCNCSVTESCIFFPSFEYFINQCFWMVMFTHGSWSSRGQHETQRILTTYKTHFSFFFRALTLSAMTNWLRDGL